MTPEQPLMTAAEPQAVQTGRAGVEQPAAMPLVYRPNVDIADCGTEVTLLADLPGARADAIDVSFEEGVLSIRAEVPPRTLPGRMIRQEYGVGGFSRSFRLGEGFDASLIEAEYGRGVLTVHVPRAAAVRPRSIPVRPA